MESLKGAWLGQGLESVGTNVYGWVQQGAAWNIDSPRDRINFGANLDWRSNDYRLNQAYFIVEKALQHEDKWDIGYRVDFLVGHDAPFSIPFIRSCGWGGGSSGFVMKTVPGPGTSIATSVLSIPAVIPPWATSRPKRVHAAKSASKCSGLRSPVISAYSSICRIVTVCVRRARWPTESPSGPIFPPLTSRGSS